MKREIEWLRSRKIPVQDVHGRDKMMDIMTSDVMETVILLGPKLLAVILQCTMMMLIIICSTKDLTGACGYVFRC